MPKSPKVLAEALATLDLQNLRGDVLADVLGVTLLRNALYKQIEGRAPWGVQMGAKPRSMFYLVARGSALLEVEGEKPLSLSVGDVVFIPHGTAHTLRDAKTTVPQHVCEGTRPTGEKRHLGGDGPVSSIIAGFFERDTGPAPVLLERLPRVMLLTPSGPNADPWIGSTVQFILAESASPGLASSLILHRLVDVLFVHALRSLGRNSSCPQGLTALSDPAVHQSLSLMHSAVAEPWTVAALAKKVGLSRSGFARRFAELVGEPPLQYLARWRIARAAELLRDTKDGIAEIAGRVGYESVPAFSRAFKRWRSTSPAAFRRESASRLELPG